MKGLIPLAQRFIAGTSTRTVSARKLHEVLGVGRDFTNWIRSRIQQYGFVENQDFIVCSPKRGSKQRGGHNAKEHYVTLDMAKELAMVERSDKGREARRYFIECE
ncbi:antA/AntB antirepressor family protein [Motiliproteus sp. MSK22-1]|uniref:antA/AntB antirepressor family protein n=1 Tax=Motiliproteus sp. MSK22-1 TaxID=1897630 RepID=UPI00117FB3E8|nr:antA/AntB antirepressor family protein [Motiliproteus sp. MSK22-1]